MHYREELNEVVRNAKIEIHGYEQIKDEAQGQLGIQLIKAYGDSPAGFVDFEAKLPRSRYRPADAVLCHPETGLIFFEVKGHSIDKIQSIHAGKIVVREKGRNRTIDPLDQSSAVMFDAKNLIERKIRSFKDIPFFDFVAVFPNIERNDWEKQKCNECLPDERFFLRDEVFNSKKFRHKLQHLIQTNIKDTGKELPLNPDQIDTIKSVFGDSAVINTTIEPRPIPEYTQGETFDQLAIMDKHLSVEQRKLAERSAFDSPRLIRGVAGSGKSIVLAIQVARLLNYIYNKHDLYSGFDSGVKILAVCFNRAFVSFLKTKIKDSYKQQTANDDFPQGGVQVTYFNGCFSSLKNETGLPLEYIPVKNVPDNETRATMYRQQLSDIKSSNPEWFESSLYDFIFVDEGQDISPEEYRLLLDLLRPHSETNEKPITIFYDDAQNVYARPRPNWKEVGLKIIGGRSFVMSECFRNTKPIVELAFNVLLGTKAPENIKVQTRQFADIEYLKSRDLVNEEENYVKVNFTERNDGPKPIVKSFDLRSSEKEWAAKEINRLINEEHVRPDDILVLFANKKEYTDIQQYIEERNYSKLIKGYLHPYSQKPDVNRYIFRQDYLTISTPHGAKGYDAFVVFFLGVDNYKYEKPDMHNKQRAAFYVGATRSKYLLYISGIAKSDSLLAEAEALLPYLPNGTNI